MIAFEDWCRYVGYLLRISWSIRGRLTIQPPSSSSAGIRASIKVLLQIICCLITKSSKLRKCMDHNRPCVGFELIPLKSFEKWKHFASHCRSFNMKNCVQYFKLFLFTTLQFGANKVPLLCILLEAAYFHNRRKKISWRKNKRSIF